MKHRVLCMLLACVMLLGLLAGCGSSSSDTETAAEAEETEETAEAEEAEAEETAEAEEEAEEETAEEEAEEAEETAEAAESEAAEETSAEAEEEEELSIAEKIAGRPSVSLPLTEEEVTLTYWIGGLNMDAPISGWAECTPIIEMEERTGVHIEWEEVSPPTQAEKYNLLIVSGDYPDIINYSDAGTVEYMIDNEIAAELTDLMEEYAPSYSALMEADEALYRATATDDGRIGGLAGYSYNTYSKTGGLMRADWLEEIGMDAPVTFDEYYEVLTAFVNTGLCEHPLAMRIDSSLSSNAFMSALGGRIGAAEESSANSFYYNEDGELVYGYVEEPFKEYITMMAQWYEEGLIYPDLLTSDMVETSMIADGSYGLFYNDCEFLDTYTAAGQVNDPDFALVGVSEPLLEEGQTTYFGDAAELSVSIFITTACDNVELALSWLDYFFSEEGSILCQYGIEGEGLVYDEDGNPQYSELITNNPDGLSMSNAMIQYTVNTNIYCKDFQPVYEAYTEEQQACIDAWNATKEVSDSSYTSYFSLSTEEQDAVSGPFTDISTYVAETVGKFLTGQMDVESEWDSYVATVESMGLQDVLDAYTAAGERYFSK